MIARWRQRIGLGGVVIEGQPGQVLIRELGCPGDLGWVVQVHGEVYAAEFGWDASFEALVAQIVADYARARDPAREAAWLAEVDGQRAGCIFCVAADQVTAKLRILLVHPSARGHGLGHGLVDTCMDFARRAGYSRMQLWTSDVLTDARAIYLQRGFRLIAQEPHHSFGADLVGQTYEADLAANRPGEAEHPSAFRRMMSAGKVTAPAEAGMPEVEADLAPAAASLTELTITDREQEPRR